MSFISHLRDLGACCAATDWVGDRAREQAWAECIRGDWTLWYLQRVGVDTRKAAFWCAERARQSALMALPPSPERDQLAAHPPIVDGKTARAAAAAAETAAWAAEASAAAETAAWAPARAAPARAAAAARAAWAAAEAAAEVARAARAAWAVEEAARAARAAWAAELSTIADYVRANYKLPEAQL